MGVNSLAVPKKRTHSGDRFSGVGRELRPSDTFSGAFSLAQKLPEVFLGGLPVLRVEGILYRKWGENAHLLLESWSENPCSDGESLSNGKQVQSSPKGSLHLRVGIHVLAHRPQAGPRLAPPHARPFHVPSVQHPHCGLCWAPITVTSAPTQCGEVGYKFWLRPVISSRHFQSFSVDWGQLAPANARILFSFSPNSFTATLLMHMTAHTPRAALHGPQATLWYLWV